MNTGHRKKTTNSKIQKIRVKRYALKVFLKVGRENYFYEGKKKNTEHIMIITALLKFQKSNIHVGEYRPQHINDY